VHGRESGRFEQWIFIHLAAACFLHRSVVVARRLCASLGSIALALPIRSVVMFAFASKTHRQGMVVRIVARERGHDDARLV
jgi:hypothetical protein